jgi:asparagine synthase (glutamine-hydrolysing)
MCGIAGEFLFDSNLRIDPARIPPMVSAIRHRGPDQWGYYIGCAGTALLINVRLSIVDLSNGKQPLPNEDGSIWVVLNGELYGFAETSEDLRRRGHRFRTRTDTEMIVHLYEEYGENFVEHLRGEFAIALLDQRKQVLYLVRDRFGIKPLFYAQLAHSLVFASEIKAIFTHPRVKPELDHVSVFHTLHQLLLPGATAFKGISTVEPGCMLRVSRSGVVQQRYWDLPLADGASGGIDEGEAVEEFRRLFEESVRIRLHGDVEVGAYVSGGLDSMAVASAAAESSRRKLKVFTVSFADPRLDELPAAAEFAAEKGFDHHVVRVGAGDLAPYFERSLWHGEIPVANSHGAAKMILSDLARHHVKVVLTGEGSDEALAGYNVFQHIVLLEQLRANSGNREIRAALDDLLQRESRGVAVTNSAVLPIREYPDYARVRQLFGAYPYAIARAFRTGKAMPYILSSQFRQEFRGADSIASMADRIGRGRMAGLSPVAAHQYYLFKADLPAYILNYLGDRVEMAHSIEGRVPMLDHKLVEFAFALPISLKLRNGSGKYILRQAVLNRLESASRVRKRPFLAPSAETLGFGSGGEGMDRYLDYKVVNEVGLFRPLAVAALRRSLKLLQPGSRALALAETTLTGIASIHALHEMFCENFAGSLNRFSVFGRQPELGEGVVLEPSQEGHAGAARNHGIASDGR